MKKIFIVILAVIFAISVTGLVARADDTKKKDEHKADLNKANETVNRIRQPDPPSVSTTTKPSPVGQPVSDYKPTAAPSLKIKEPPPPSVDKRTDTKKK